MKNIKISILPKIMLLFHLSTSFLSNSLLFFNTSYAEEHSRYTKENGQITDLAAPDGFEATNTIELDSNGSPISINMQNSYRFDEQSNKIVFGNGFEPIIFTPIVINIMSWVPIKIYQTNMKHPNKEGFYMVIVHYTNSSFEAIEYIETAVAPLKNEK